MRQRKRALAVALVFVITVPFPHASPRDFGRTGHSGHFVISQACVCLRQFWPTHSSYRHSRHLASIALRRLREPQEGHFPALSRPTPCAGSGVPSEVACAASGRRGFMAASAIASTLSPRVRRRLSVRERSRGRSCRPPIRGPGLDPGGYRSLVPAHGAGA